MSERSDRQVYVFDQYGSLKMRTSCSPAALSAEILTLVKGFATETSGVSQRLVVDPNAARSRLLRLVRMNRGNVALFFEEYRPRDER